jgi:hypothetical protein
MLRWSNRGINEKGVNKKKRTGALDGIKVLLETNMPENGTNGSGAKKEAGGRGNIWDYKCNGSCGNFFGSFIQQN